MLNLRLYSLLAIGVAAFVAVAFDVSAKAVAQAASGQISGSVRGQGGDPVRGAIVGVSSRDGRIQRTTRTNAVGTFVFSGLPAGSYTMQSCAEQWGLSAPADVQLKAGTEVIQDLQIGSAVPGTLAGSCNPNSISSPSPRDTGVRVGEAVSLDLNGDIREFFRVIAASSRFEFDVSPINRRVTVHLRNVPWELALDAVLKTSGLASELDGAVLRISTADPSKGQDRVLMGTVTVAGRITAFNFQNPRSLIQVNAPNAEGTIQTWPVEWESADYLKELGITPNTLRVGDLVLAIGNVTRDNAIRLISIRRLSDGFSWGYLSAGRVAPFDGVMFVGSMSQ